MQPRHDRARSGPRLAALLAFGLVPFLGQATEWTWENPRPVPYTLRAPWLVDAGHGVLVGDQGTIMTTDDGGSSWTPRPSGVSLDSNFSRVQFIDPTTVTAVGGVVPVDFSPPTGFVLRSTDGGATWTTQVTTPNVLIFAVDFVDANTGTAVGVDYTTAEPTMLRTTDGGASWSSSTFDYLGLATAVTFVDADVGYVVGLDLAGATSVVLRTGDGGATWAHQTAASDQPLNDVAFYDANRGFAVGNAGTLFETSDGGTTWSAVDAGTTLDLHRIALIDPQTLAIAGGDSGQTGIILTSSDGGATFTSQSFGRSIEGIHFSDPSHGFATGTGGEMLRTTDGGATWIDELESFSANGLQAVSFADRDVATAVGTNGLVVRTTDGGTTWETQSSGTDLVLYGVSAPDAQFAMAVGGDVTGGARIVIASSDGGATWIDRTPPDLPFAPMFGVSCASVGSCTVVGYCGVIVHTDDGGESWTTQREADCTGHTPLQAVHFVDTQNGTAVGQFAILRTTDGGASWSGQTDPSDQVLRGVVFTDPGHGFAVGGHQQDMGTILHTSDGGATWDVQRSDIATPVQSIDCAGERCAAVTLDGRILRTDDAGATWSQDTIVSANLYGVATPDTATATAVGWANYNAVVLGWDDRVFGDGFD